MKKFIFVFGFVFLAVFVFVLLVVLCTALAENLLLPSDFLFYEHTPFAAQFLAVLMVVPAFFISYSLVYHLVRKITTTECDPYHIVWLGRALGKWNIPIVIVWMLALYACSTSLTYVTSKTIVSVTPFDLKGQEYRYSDVEKIEAGFGDRKRALFEHQKEGNFYYKIFLPDDEIVFCVTSANMEIERYEDTYLELEEFDRALREYAIPKEASAEGYDKCDFEQRYVERFLRIIDSE